MPDLSGIQILGTSLDTWLEILVLLLSFTLALFVLLTLGVRALMIFRKLPVPVDLVDMTKPRDFRTLMLGSAALLTPLVASYFLPDTGQEPQSILIVSYALEIVLAVALWFILDRFYRARERRRGSKA
jgi:hypothetical protein